MKIGLHPNVSIIVLNWNNSDDTIECLDSLININYDSYNIVLIDNGSIDDSVDKIKKHVELLKKDRHGIISLDFVEIDGDGKCGINQQMVDGDIFLIQNQRNEGFALGNNIGVNFAINHLDPKYVLLLNNDTIVEPTFLMELVKCIEENDDVALCQAKLLFYDAPNIINSTGNLMDPFGSTFCRGYGEIEKNQFDEQAYCGFFYASGACLLIRCSFIEKMKPLALFDSELFAYHEDVDLSWIARLMGFEIAYCPKSICYHKDGRSLRGNMSLLKEYYTQRNNIRVIIKNYSILEIAFVLPICLSLEFICSLIYSIYHRNPKYMAILGKSICWNIIHLEDSMRLHKVMCKKIVIERKSIRKKMHFGLLKFIPIWLKIKCI